MINVWNSQPTLSVMFMLVLLCSCEPFYDPVEDGDVPTSPGSKWDKKTIVVRDTAAIPFEPSDLSQTMTLSQLLDIALYNNPSTRWSWNAARASAFAYRASLSDYYPTVVLNSTLNAQANHGSTYANSGQSIITNPTTTPTSSTQSFDTNVYNDLSMTYLLLDFGGRSATAELALQTLYASNWQHNYTMQQVMLSVLTSYTSYMGNQGLVEAYKQDLIDAQVALNAAQLMRRNGLATLNDVLSTQASLEMTRANLIQAEGSEKAAIGELLIALGLPPDTELTIEQLPQKLPVVDISGNISSLLELAKKKRPDLGIAIAEIKQQEAQLAIAYSNSMPTLSANLAWNQLQLIWPKAIPGYTEIASLELNVPLFQGFYYLNLQRQLRAQIEEALANLDVQLATVYTGVVTAYYSFISAEAALPATEAALEYSKRAFRGYVIQYKTGTASILDVLNALTALSNARAQVVITRTQWASSLANLAFAVGMLDDTGGLWKSEPPKDLFKIPIKDNVESQEEGKKSDET